MAVLLGITAGAIMLSAFTTPKQIKKTECSQFKMNSGWKCYRENVPYCDGESSCAGYGEVWINNDTYQVAFKVQSGSVLDHNTKYDLASSTALKGYNMRFYASNKYWYVNLYIPDAAWNY